MAEHDIVITLLGDNKEAKETISETEESAESLTKKVEITNDMTAQLGRTSRQVFRAYNEGAKEAVDTSKKLGNGLDELLFKTKKIDKDTGELRDKYAGMRMEFLSVMFVSRALADSIGSLFEPTKEAFQVSEILSDTLLFLMAPAFEAIFPLLIGFVDRMLSFSETTRTVIGLLSLLVLGIFSLLAALAAGHMMLGGFAKALMGFFTVSAASSIISGILLMTKAIAFLVSGFAAGIAVTELLSEEIGRLIDFFVTLATVAGIVAAVVIAVVAGLGAIPVILAGAVAAGVGYIIARWEEVVDLFKNFPEFLADLFTSIPGLLISPLGALVGLIIDNWQEIKDTVTSIVYSAMETVGDIFEWFVNTVFSYVSSVGEFFSDIFGTVVDTVKTAVSNVVGEIVSIPENILDALKNIYEFFKDVFGDVYEFITDNFIERVVDGFWGLVDDVADIGESIYETFIDALPTLSDITDTLMSGASTLTSSAMNALDFLTPGIDLNDFVISGGKVHKIHPRDKVVGFKGDGLGASSGGGGGDSIRINIDADVDSDVDIRKMAKEIERRLEKKRRSRFTR